MTLEFAIQEARRRTDVLKTNHYVYCSLFEDGYIVTDRELFRGWEPVYSAFVRKWTRKLRDYDT